MKSALSWWLPVVILVANGVLYRAFYCLGEEHGRLGEQRAQLLRVRERLDQVLDEQRSVERFREALRRVLESADAAPVGSGEVYLLDGPLSDER